VLKIKGKVKRIKREKHPAPKDGVHRVGRDNCIKGVKSIWIGDRLVPRGSVGFYVRCDSDRGVKVYLGFPTGKKPWMSKPRVVREAYKHMTHLHLNGLAPCPRHVIQVAVDVVIDGKRVKCKPWALEMDHVHYDEGLWADYAVGKPYDWNAIDHPDHNPEGYKRFVKKVKAFQRLRKMKLSAADWKGDEVPKLGDCLWCAKKKRWFIVDVD